MIVMDYKDAGAFAALFFMIAAILTLIPVLWVGDIAITFIGTAFTNPPKIVYIVSWILACGGYYFYFLERYVAGVLLKKYDRTSQLIVFYAQGLFFAYLLSLTSLGTWSLIPIKLLNATIGGLFRWLFL